MSGGGGKGGSNTAQTQIPDWLKQPAVRNIGRAEALSRVGYTPYYGPDVAAFSPMQQQAMQGTMDMASAFGMAPQGSDAMAGVPAAQDFGNGLSGYSSGGLFDQAVAELEQRRPNQAAEYNQLFVDPTADPAAQFAGSGMSPEQTQALQQMFAGGRYGGR
jgi:hypothetical protein